VENPKLKGRGEKNRKNDSGDQVNSLSQHTDEKWP